MTFCLLEEAAAHYCTRGVPDTVNQSRSNCIGQNALQSSNDAWWVDWHQSNPQAAPGSQQSWHLEF